MAKKSPVIQMKKIVDRIGKSMTEAIKSSALKPTADFLAEIVVKRTRLGYGVDNNYGKKTKLAALSKRYVKSRTMFAGLNPLTTPKKSNLTRTGQMLDSIRARTRDGIIIIEPTGRRDDGLSNADVAMFAHMGSKNRPKRVFMNVSELEFKQTLRFYRKNFTDLLRKLKVI